MTAGADVPTCHYLLLDMRGIRNDLFAFMKPEEGDAPNVFVAWDADEPRQ